MQTKSVLVVPNFNLFVILSLVFQATVGNRQGGQVTKPRLSSSNRSWLDQVCEPYVFPGSHFEPPVRKWENTLCLPDRPQ